MEQASSLIKNVSNLSEEEVAQQETPFEFWGPTPREARKAAVAKKKGLRDKRMTMKEAVDAYVKDDMSIGIGGFVNTRVPVAIIHEIIRHGAKNLHISFQSQSLCAELLAGAMILDDSHLSISTAEIAWWGYEIIGIAPLFRYLTKNGMIKVDDYTNYGMSARFKAGAMGLPFIPIKDQGGSDMERVNRGKMMQCPFTGDNTYLIPAINPDLGIIHTQVADQNGNARIFGALCTCPEIAQASNRCIMSVEQVIPTESIRQYPNLTEIPYVVVDAVVEQPLGAYPGAVYGYNWFDMPEMLAFRKVCDDFRKTGNKDGLKEYFDKYVYGCETFDDYLATRPYKTIKELKQNDQCQPIII